MNVHHGPCASRKDMDFGVQISGKMLLNLPRTMTLGFVHPESLESQIAKLSRTKSRLQEAIVA